MLGNFACFFCRLLFLKITFQEYNQTVRITIMAGVLLVSRQRLLVGLYCFRLVHPSVRPLSWSLPNFIYGWLPSIANFRSSLNTGQVCLTNDNQDGRQNARRLSVSAVVVTLNWISSKYHISTCFHQTLIQVRLRVLSDEQ